MGNKAWIWIGVVAYYLLTALAVFIYAHEDIEQKKNEKNLDIEEGDVAGPVIAALLWPLLPFAVVWLKAIDYATFAPLRRRRDRWNAQKVLDEHEHDEYNKKNS